jgi:hypothetical protein
MIKKDNFYTGLVVAVITPVLFYALLSGIDWLLVQTFGKSMVAAPHYLYLLAVTPNLFWMRYYLSNLKFTKAGFTVFLVTMIFIILYFLKYFQNPVES